MRGAKLFAAALAILSVLTGTSRADSAPEWVRAVVESSAPNYDKSAPFVVLLDERVTTVKNNGKAETRSRYVLRVLNQEGRVAGRREIFYDSQTKISDLHAWHIRADEKVFKLGGRNAIEESISDDLYSEIRSKVMRFGEVDIGSVVAFEWVRKEKPLVYQDFHFFQTKSPVVASRYQLNLPDGWRVETHTFNHDPIAPLVNDNTYMWQLQNLPPITEEPRMPEITGISPYLAVTYFPPDNRDGKGALSSWQDVSQWAGELMERRGRDEDLIESQAKDLTGGLDSEIEKARAISRWVQKNIRYVSIQLGAIGGYRPNYADTVLKKGYGDCKDKSALMRAMLRSIGIASYMMLVFTGDPARVRPEFPSPLQFNHAIVAVALKSDASGVLNHPRFGRLLFFDPTDSVTPLGDLPFYLQGSYGLLVKGDSGDLIRLPIRAESANRLRRELKVEVKDNGEIFAAVKEVATGQLASVARQHIYRTKVEEYARELGSQVARDIPGAMLSDLKINRDADPEESLILEYAVKASRYANRLGNLLVMRPILLWAQNHPVFTKPERTYPVLFEMQSVKEDVVEIELPQGFEVDEAPADTEIKTGFGEFTLRYEVNEQRVLVRRSLTITKQMAPASEYEEIKRFFDSAQAASQSSIVLVSR